MGGLIVLQAHTPTHPSLGENFKLSKMSCFKQCPVCPTKHDPDLCLDKPILYCICKESYRPTPPPPALPPMRAGLHYSATCFSAVWDTKLEIMNCFLCGGGGRGECEGVETYCMTYCMSLPYVWTCT